MIIEELKQYCRDSEPQGVIMLTGEWGCGKTHFIEQDLREEVKEFAVILRISLFGLTSQDEVKNAIKQTWLDEKIRGKKWSENTKKIKDVISRLPLGKFLPERFEGVISFDVKTLISDMHEIDGRKVILVFDDLERCAMDLEIVLGMINDYFEKEKYPIIVIANEDKIHASGDEMSYHIIKEKVISRTIKYIPDYKKVVESVIEGLPKQNLEYHNFLARHIEKIQTIFALESQGRFRKDDNEHRIYNLRWLISAINDFDRVYECLWNEKISNISFFFDTYLQYTLADRLGKKTVDAILKLYPDFQVGYMMDTVKMWVRKGIWNKECIVKEAKIILQRYENFDLSRDIACNNILDLDEEITEKEYDNYLKMAYEGNLCADEYVVFIENSSLIRQCQYMFPSIDWSKVAEGIRIQAKRIIDSDESDSVWFHKICDLEKGVYSQEERKAYAIVVEQFAEKNLRSCMNQKLYIQRIKTSENIYLDDLMIDVFDEHMAESTFVRFKKLTNKEKHSFIEIFADCFKKNIKNKEFNRKDSEYGFEKLNSFLQKLLTESSNKQAIYHIKNLMKIVENLKNECVCIE